MESKQITVNGYDLTCYEDGSIEWFHRRHKRLHRILGSCGGGYRLVVLGGRTFKVHRLIAQAFLDDWDESLSIDHINNNGLDNTIGNLRMATRSLNGQAMRKTNKNATSIYRGVFWRKDRGVYVAKIYVNKKTINLGHFDNEVDAALAFDKAAIKAGRPEEGLNRCQHPELIL